MKREWLKLSIECDPQLVDSITDYLAGNPRAGVEVGVEDRLLSRIVNVFLERETSSQDEETVRLLKEHLKLLADIFKVKTPTMTMEIIPDQDWSTAWKQHFHPFAIVPGLIIAPTWEKYRVKPDEQLIEIDPGLAFGTGHHETTTLALELSRKVIEGGATSVLDVGTGTGILAMAAARFGAGQVLGIDNDPEAVTVARANVKANHLAGRVEIRSTNLSDLVHPVSLVMANIIQNVLIELHHDLCRLVAHHGHLILSGILAGEQTETIIPLFQKHGLVHRKTKTAGEWAALLFNKRD